MVEDLGVVGVMLAETMEGATDIMELAEVVVVMDMVVYVVATTHKITVTVVPIVVAITYKITVTAIPRVVMATTTMVVTATTTIYSIITPCVRTNEVHIGINLSLIHI